MYDNKFAVQTQVYGPEARGGASMSAVIIDDDPILYPKVATPGIYVIMSQEGFEKYGADAPGNAVMLIDSTLVHSRPSCTFYEIPATYEAKQTFGRDIVANIIMMGALSLQLVSSAKQPSKRRSSICTEGNRSTQPESDEAGDRTGYREKSMSLREYEAKKILKDYGIPVPAGFWIRTPDELPGHFRELGEKIVLKAQVDVGGRGKAGRYPDG